MRVHPSSLCRTSCVTPILACRSGDLIRPKGDTLRPWDPSRDTHRGRVRFEQGRDSSGVSYRRLIVDMKPSKTDPSGEEKWEVSFRIDPDPSSLSAGAAICAMLRGDDDPHGTEPEREPLFRNPDTGREILYAESHQALKCRLIEAGFDELAHGLHSLRIGGATALASDPNGGEFAAGCAGLWVSDCKFKYFYAVRERIEAAAFSAGQRGSDSVARRPGPLSSYR